ncbi:MAG: STAS domain-containing protein [Cyanobacteriota bacterium]|nr:STAS domain-containing protein [Cyanobacteriota bacterium]
MSVRREVTIQEPLSLTVSLRGSHEVLPNCQVFHLTGLLDAFSEPVFRKVVSKFIEEGSANVVLDLSHVDFVDSSGVGALVSLAKQARDKGGDLQIVTNPRVTQTVKLMRLEKFLPLQNTLDEAVSHFG